jgi:hypothetical protein
MSTPAILIPDRNMRYGRDRDIEKINLQAEEGEIFVFSQAWKIYC